MAKPMSSVKVLAASRPSGERTMEPERHSVSVRQIANGYITETSTCRDGEYRSSETFSQDKPNLEIARATGPDTGNSMRDAIDAIKGR